MMREQGKVSARLLQRIRDRVQKWYHDEGYACAQVVNFGNLNTREVVCEVVEGDITQMVVQFQDKLGNVCEGSTQLPVVYRELPKQVFWFSFLMHQFACRGIGVLFICFLLIYRCAYVNIYVCGCLFLVETRD